MNPDTGELFELKITDDAKAKGLVPVRRDLRNKEKATMQIALYSECVCGSGKKFKFCCKTKKVAEPVKAPTLAELFPPRAKKEQATANVG